MKFLFLFLLGILSLNSVQAKDSKPSDFGQELFYTMIVHDLGKNIQQAYIQSGFPEKEAGLTVALVLSHIDMLSLKKKTLNCFKDKKITFGFSENQVPDLDKCVAPWIENFVEKSKTFEGKTPDPQEGFILLFLTAIAQQTQEEIAGEKIPFKIAQLARQTAYGRTNIQKEKKEIKGCLDKKKIKTSSFSNEAEVKQAFECFEKYKTNFQTEYLSVLKSLSENESVLKSIAQ